MNAATLAGMAKKRGYSREFRPHGDTGKRYLLDEIPAGLWREVREKAKRDGISIRARILSLLRMWLEIERCERCGRHDICGEHAAQLREAADR